MYFRSDYNNLNHINFIDPYVSISYRDNRVFEGSAFQFSCGTYPPGLGAGLQLSVDGEIVNTTADNRIFSTFDGYTVHFTIEPALLEEDGILLECVLQTINGTFVSESSILLLVLERFSTLLSHIKVSHPHQHPILPNLQLFIERMRSNDHLPSMGLYLFCAARDCPFNEDDGVYYSPDSA